MNHFLLTLAIALADYFDCYDQPTWEKVLANVRKGKNEQSAIATTKPFKDKDYNFGSESISSPRINTVSWSDLKGGLRIFGGCGYDQNYQWGVFRKYVAI